MLKIKNQIQRIIASGFIHVFSANIVSQLVAFCGGVFYARLMGRHDFGIYAFAYSIISFFLLVNGFGAASGVLQFVSRERDSQMQLSYLKYSITLGVLFNCGLSLIIALYALFVHIPVPGVRSILLAMALFPVGRLYIDVFQSYLRATQQNQLLAKFAISTNLILLLSNILGIYLYGLFGFVAATYISYVVIVFIATFIYKLPNILAIKASIIEVRKFIYYSIYATVGNAFAQLLFILDVILLGYVIKSAQVVAVYKAATIIPFGFNFIPGVISAFFYPYFAKNSADLTYVRLLKNKIQSGMLIFTTITSGILIILAKPLILLIFGPQYIASVLPFQILMGGFPIVATFRNIPGNILASLGHAKFAMWLNCFILSVNIVLTYILVVHYGIIGAAIGVVGIYILASLIATGVLNQILSRK